MELNQSVKKRASNMVWTAAGRYDFEPVVAWAAAACPGIPCVVENSVPATVAGCLTTLERMSARCEGVHREM